MDKNECEDKYSESETEEHLTGKRDLYEWIKTQDGVTNAVLEGWIPDTKQRPDIMFEYNGNSYVIEYQCSPIASEYIERHELYKAAGIIDIWILGVEKYLRPNMRTKYIQNYAYAFYSCKLKKFALIKCNSLYYRLKSARRNYGHNEESFLFMSIAEFEFDGEIYHKMFGHIDIAINKINNRTNNKPLKNKEPNKYLNKHICKIRVNLEQNLFRLSNSNWHFYLRKNTMYVEPNVDNYCHYVILNNLRKSNFKVIRIKDLSFNDFKLCSRDIEFLKTLLFPIMKYNKRALLQYKDSELRFLEVREN